MKIAFGTDSGVSAHGINAEEFLLMEKAGMSRKEALIAATVSGADNLGAADLGQIAPGFRADVIAVDADPLADLSALQSVDFVMKDGVVFKQDGAPAAGAP